MWPQAQCAAHGYHTFGTVAAVPFPMTLQATLETRDDYESQIRLFEPSLLVLGHAYLGESCITYDFLRQLRQENPDIRIVARHAESHIDGRMAHFANLVPLVDILYTHSPTWIRAYEELTGGENIRLMFGATDPGLFYPVDVEKQIDLLFVGHLRGSPALADRNDLIYKLNEEFEDLWIAGNWWDKARLNHWTQGIYAHDFSQWSSRARIGLSLVPEAQCIEMYHTWRTLNIMATGTFALVTYTPRLEEIFTRGEYLDWYTSYEELGGLIHYYLEHETEREEIARRGYEYIIHNCTFRHQAQRVLKDVGLLK